ncbi:hypothetical protein C5H23_04030 [Xylella fastidiosa]|uniref:hypothetical protein n=1 Tax=Xylella fastidiosa TaxID=2371 RepID=UPI00112045F9|nr:hypothetical protein [Xylella fastidiosa]MDD0930281.1 hypothetical protein [Xylella fastidiosa subsp. multiplex]TNV90076.1 hypothetical protein C5H23_04030 [Xylella fastidiosa]
MSDDTNTATVSFEAVTPPTNDAQAALQEQQQQPTPEPSSEPPSATGEADKQAEEKKKQGNRTREYIQRINGENNELRRRLEALERQQQPVPTRSSHTPQAGQEGAPGLEDYAYNWNEWADARFSHLFQQWQQEQQQAETVRQQHSAQARYEARAAEFMNAHPDFYETVGSMDLSLLSPAVQAAVIQHEKGPEIAYHLATQDDALWSLASVREDLLPAAVERLAARMATPQTHTPLTSGPSPGKPISNAPPPPPSVSGRSPAEIPSEKLTDDDWYRRDVDKRRKR